MVVVIFFNAVEYCLVVEVGVEACGGRKAGGKEVGENCGRESPESF